MTSAFAQTIRMTLAGLEAAVLLVTAVLLTKLVAYRRWKGMLGVVTASPKPNLDPVDMAIVRTVERAVDGVARRLPFQVLCMPRAMAAKWMLDRRNLASTLFIGIRRKGIGASLTGEGRATELHAWLRVGERIVTGRDAVQDYHVIACIGGRVEARGKAERSAS
ncbi:MAG: lasso peptide biosynthesis B2 protein [Hyphomicrobiaceae bacterium]